MESVSLPEDPKSSAENPPVGWTELVVVAVAVALCDLTIFRGHGYAGMPRWWWGCRCCWRLDLRVAAGIRECCSPRSC